MNAIPVLEARLLSPNELLAELQARFDNDADEFNQVAELCEQQDTQLKAMATELETLRLQLATTTDKCDALTAGNRVLMEENRDLKKNLEVSGQQIIKLRLSETNWVDKSREQDKTIKSLREHGDPKKLLEQNKTIRAKNAELVSELDKTKRLLKDMDKFLSASVERGGDYFNIPIFKTPNGQHVYMHDKHIHVIQNGVEVSVIPMSFWTADGIGRTITWDGENVNFASFGHKTVDLKHAPEPELVAFVRQWYEENVLPQGVKQVIRKKKFLVKTK